MGLTDPSQLSSSLLRHMELLNQDTLPNLERRTDANLPPLRSMIAEIAIGMRAVAGYINSIFVTAGSNAEWLSCGSTTPRAEVLFSITCYHKDSMFGLPSWIWSPPTVANHGAAFISVLRDLEHIDRHLAYSTRIPS